MSALGMLAVNSNQLDGPLPDAWGANGSFSSLLLANLVLHLRILGMPCMCIPGTACNEHK